MMRKTSKAVAVAVAMLGVIAVWGPGAGAVPVGPTGIETARWWQWSIAQPLTDHPLADPTTADCTTDQAGDVWYLGGVFNATGTVERDCTIPGDVALLVPAVNAECSTVEPDPFYGANASQLRTCAHAVAMDGAFVSLDGHDQPIHWVESPVYRFSGPDDNVLFVPGAIEGKSVAWGAWALIPPLGEGEHELRFGGTFTDYGWTLDITYHLTVA
jgi:hypothetical protein